MKRVLKAAAALTAIILIGVAGWIYYQVSSLSTVKITEDLYMLHGMGGNVAVLKTGKGAIIVDSMAIRLQGQNIVEKARELTGESVIMLINSHYHSDHTHGNPGFKNGIRIISTTNTFNHLQARDAEYWQDEAQAFLPNELVDSQKELKIGNKTIRLIYPGKGHTDGDIVVQFVEDKTIHTGDLYFTNYYPNIDLEGGGSVQKWPATLNKVLALSFEHVISGHGAVSDRNGIRNFQKFMAELAAHAKQSASHGMSLEETIATADFKENTNIEPFGVPFVFRFDKEFVITRAWEEATNKSKETK